MSCKFCDVYARKSDIRVIYMNALFAVVVCPVCGKLAFISNHHNQEFNNVQAGALSYFRDKLFGYNSTFGAVEYETHKEFAEAHAYGHVENPFGFNKEKVKFSIITPTHRGREKMLQNLSNSLLWQSYQDYEWIIIEDGRSFEIRSVVDGMRKRPQHIVFIQTDPTNGWGNYQRNAGIQVAQGEYCVFIDDDDLPSVQWLELLQKHTVSICRDVIIIGAYWNMGEKDHYYLPNSRELISMCHISTQNIACKTEIAREVGWPLSKEREADFAFIDRVRKRTSDIIYEPQVGILINAGRINL